MSRLLIILCISLITLQCHSQSALQLCIRDSSNGVGIPGALISLEDSLLGLTGLNGCLSLVLEAHGTLKVSALGYNLKQVELSPNAKNHQNIDLEPAILGTAEVIDERVAKADILRMRSVEDFAIYASKKSEVISPEGVILNHSQNQSRQTFGRFAGITVWDDASGLQLNMGARGLDPNRSSNFTVRQGGYEISADPLGYPESYYTPPMQAVERIELIRGTGALQYGSQFGGMLNFNMKKGDSQRKLKYHLDLGAASFNSFNVFQSVGGQVGRLNYYLAHSLRKGEGWRPNSGYESNTFFGGINYRLNDRSSIRMELTHMNYLAQQAGGLTNSQFILDPSVSTRSRNWFSVHWNTAGLEYKYELSEQTRFKVLGFGLVATRNALGHLGPVNRIDPGDNRELIQGSFNNYGVELKLEHRFFVADKYSVAIAGFRLFKGSTNSMQGTADDGSGPSFSFLESNRLSGSDFDFSSDNQALFLEQIIYLSDRFSINPGVRLELINTGSEGYYTTTLQDGAGNVLPGYPTFSFENSMKKRAVFLAGIGAQYNLNEKHEFYANITQNYRAVNFSDLYVSIPGLRIDDNLSDESGFSADIGWRWYNSSRWRLESSLFWLEYKDRIGAVYTRVDDPILGSQAVQLRSNLADARSLGVEWSLSFRILSLESAKNKKLNWSALGNGSFIRARYLNGPSFVKGNVIENVPEYNLRLGSSLEFGKFLVQYTFNYTGLQYTDATNANQLADPTAVIGAIPAWFVSDVACQYQPNSRLIIRTGINNLFDQLYFSRRATGYPGPGILPSDPRSLFISLSLSL